MHLIKFLSNSIAPWWRNVLVPRIVFIPFWIMRLVLIPTHLIRLIYSKNQKEYQPTTLCIEAGSNGWEVLIEYKELFASACEYLGSNRVHKIQISRDVSYLKQVRKAVEDLSPTHYFYDPRTGSQEWYIGLWQAFRISLLLYTHRVTPVALLTDLPVRLWRTQCAMVTAVTGVVVSLMSARVVYPIFPHRRLVAPSLMALSEKTVSNLNALYKKRKECRIKKAIFVGSLYEPRTSFLREIDRGLRLRGFALEICGRKLGCPRISDSEYWAMLSNATLVVTTADQIIEKGTDWAWIPHLIYRYLEVIACGTLLVAPEVHGITRFFSPGQHFVSFESPRHAVEVIEYYLVNDSERRKIETQGMCRAHALVRARIFWTGIDIGLGKNSLT